MKNCSGIIYVVLLVTLSMALAVTYIPGIMFLGSWVTPPVALFIGLLFAIVFGQPFPDFNKKISKKLLQYSVVGLGFGMNIEASLASGKDGMLFTIISVFGTLLIGWLIGRKLLNVDRNTSYLISSGTAICGGSAIAKGRGEIIVPLPDIPETIVVLAKLRNLDVSTAWVYKNYNPGRVVNNPSIEQIAEELSKGGKAIAPYMGNVLETVTIPANPQIASIKAAMLSAGAYYSMMSGSGPTVFAFAENQEIAEKIVDALKYFDVETAITTTVRRKEI